MVLILDEQKIKQEVEQFGFRPLAGIMVLITTDTTKYYYAPYIVSVPLRGLWFLSVLYASVYS